MSCEIICPYCFHKMKDSEVLFRSEKVNKGDYDLLPDEYDDIDDFIARYNGPDKEVVLTGYRDWAFFAEGEDEVYEKFWSEFNGTTEFNPADEQLKVTAYLRKVINPALPEHQKYLEPQGSNGYFIRDNGMVTQIKLSSGEICNRRVCCRCHNPLPDGYGTNPVKFITVIGITGAGKTVYLSQLLQRMADYVVKAGLSSSARNSGVQIFLESNTIAASRPLPGSTPYRRFQQPLFYEMSWDAKEHGRVVETFVLYDVAGEVFTHSELVDKFAPFVSHADGVIVLIDPMQLNAVSGVTNQGKSLSQPATVLDAIHNALFPGDANAKCTVPFAICLSKADKQQVQDVLSDKLRDLLREEVHGTKDASGFNLPLFNAVEYSPIFNELYKFLQNSDMALAQKMQTNYASYAYFAFTALGCPVGEFKKIQISEYEKMKRQSRESEQQPPPQYIPVKDDTYPDSIFERKRDTGELLVYHCPVGPVLPKRVEEPLLWLFHKLGYIGVNAPIDDPTRPKFQCPICGRFNTRELPEDQRKIVTGWGPFKKVRYVDWECLYPDCGHRWEQV